jgi:hypothetical protein
MRLIHIRAQADEEIDCLLRELAAYSPNRVEPRTILIELSDGSNNDLLALLSATEACVSENHIRSVRVELDGETYTIAAQ